MAGYNEKGQCTCKDCEDQRAALQRQLDHPFYKRVESFRDEIRLETMKKGRGEIPGAIQPKIMEFNTISQTCDGGEL